MVRRNNNRLPENLPMLQNLVKRDPASYREEFAQQHRYFLNTIEVFELSPERPNKSLDDLSTFMAQVAHCYPEELKNFPQQLIDLLTKHGTVLDASTRMTFCRALILLRNKNLLAPTDLLELFFRLLRCPDRSLRAFLRNHIATDIRNLNAKHKNAKLNAALQNFMFAMLKDSNSRAAKMSVDIMIELYKKNVWNDAKTVNVIATGCFSPVAKVMVASLKFFLGKDEDEKNSDGSDSEEEIDPKEVMMANKVNKTTRKRLKQLDKVKKLASKQYKKKSAAPVFNFSALHLIHDPQGMAEKLFKLVENTNKRFEIKLMLLDVVSRLIGLHGLFLFNYYPYVQRFMQPHQREVTRLLQFAAQASHELVPPDVIEPLLRTLADNFVTERNSSDVMAIGLNAMREVCARCPLAMDADLLGDLAQYRTYRDRSVMMAAKSLVQLFRSARPELLRKRDKSRPTEADAEAVSLNYGCVDAKDYVVGAEVLLQSEDEGFEIGSGSDSDSDCDKWVDVEQSDDGDSCGEDEEEEIESEIKDAEAVKDGSVSVTVTDKKQDGDESVSKDSVALATVVVDNSDKKLLRAKRKNERLEIKRVLAKKATLDRILTDEDFRRIDVENVRKQVSSWSNGKGSKRKSEESAKNVSELVKLSDIENIHKKRKHDKSTRLESVKNGQKDREKFGYKDGRVNEFCSTTNREKRKKKNVQMLRHKVGRKVKRSFKDKQVALRNHLLKLKKMK